MLKFPTRQNNCVVFRKILMYHREAVFSGKAGCRCLFLCPSAVFIRCAPIPSGKRGVYFCERNLGFKWEVILGLGFLSCKNGFKTQQFKCCFHKKWMYPREAVFSCNFDCFVVKCSSGAPWFWYLPSRSGKSEELIAQFGWVGFCTLVISAYFAGSVFLKGKFLQN